MSSTATAGSLSGVKSSPPRTTSADWSTALIAVNAVRNVAV